MQPGSAITIPVCGAVVTVPKYGQVPVWIRNAVVASVPSDDRIADTLEFEHRFPSRAEDRRAVVVCTLAG
jgi:hypothetical protein